MERVGLAAAAVEREHQLAAQTLAERGLGDERLELRDERVLAAESEVGVGAILERRETELFQPRDLALCEGLVPQVGQRLPAPERKRLAQIRSSARSGSTRCRARASSDSNLARSSSLHGDVHQIAGRARLDPVCAEELAQGGDVPVQRGLRGPGGRLSPKGVDQLLAAARPPRDAGAASQAARAASGAPG